MLPFSHLHVWQSVRARLHSIQDPEILQAPHTISAIPPTSTLPYGRYDTVLIVDSDNLKAQSVGIEGEFES